MPLRLRRGTDQERLNITPAEGEPIYVTDTQKLYIGDGTTVGGNELFGSVDGALELTADLPLNGFNLLGEDSKVIYDSSTDSLTVTSITTDLTGSVFGTDSVKIIDGDTGEIFGQVVISNTIKTDGVAIYDIGSVSDRFGTVYADTIDLGGVSLSFSSDNFTVSSNFNVEGNLSSDTLTQITNTQGPSYTVTGISGEDGESGISYYSSRGTTTAPASLQPGDLINSFISIGHDGTDYVLSSVITQGTDPNGAINDSTNRVPGQIMLLTSLGGDDPDSTNLNGLIVKRNGSVTIGKNIDEDANATLDVNGNVAISGYARADVIGSVFGDDSTTLVDGVDNLIRGNVDTTSVNTVTLELRGLESGISVTTSGTLDNDINVLSIYSIHDTTGFAGATAIRGRGTLDAPAPAQANDIIFGDVKGVFTGGDEGTTVTSLILYSVDGTPSDDAVGGKISVQTSNSSGVLQEALTIDSTQTVTIPGNLIVQGTTTSVNTADTTVSDNIITLNAGESGAGITLGTAGIEIDRGDSSTVSFLYNDSIDKWTLGSEILVTGGLEIAGAFALPTADGTAGQVLTTDGLGNTSWTTVSGSGSATSLDGDVSGSVFGDDSTLLVDGVRNLIVGEISTQHNLQMNQNDIEGLYQITSTTGTHSITMIDGAPLSIVSTNSTDISGDITLGGSSKTIDFVSGTTVDFAGATVSNLPGTLPTRNTASDSTSASHADGTDEDLDLTGYKGYALLKIQTDDAAWVRIYTSDNARTTDAARLETTDPAPDAGVIAEVITTGAETVLISPGAFGFNDETTPTTTIPVAVRNKSGVTKSITVTLTILQMEA